MYSEIVRFVFISSFENNHKVLCQFQFKAPPPSFERGRWKVRLCYLVRLPVAEGLHGGGSGGRHAAELQGRDGGAAPPQVSQQRRGALDRLLLRLGQTHGHTHTHTHTLWPTSFGPDRHISGSGGDKGPLSQRCDKGLLGSSFVGLNKGASHGVIHGLQTLCVLNEPRRFPTSLTKDVAYNRYIFGIHIWRKKN